MDKPSHLIGQKLARRFAVDEYLHTNELGDVYSGTDRRDGNQIEVHALPEAVSEDEALRRAFLRDVELARAVVHPGIVRVVTVVQLRGQLFLISDAAHGPTLRQELQVCRNAGKRINVMDVVTFARVLCEALGDLHETTPHGDLRPDVIHFDRTGGVKVAGLARGRIRRRVRAGLGNGADVYTAPDVGTDRFDTGTDQYSVAAMLYEMLTGEGAGDERPSLSELRADMPPWLAAGIDRGLSADPGQRFPDIRAFLQAVAGVATVR